MFRNGPINAFYSIFFFEISNNDAGFQFKKFITTDERSILSSVFNLLIILEKSKKNQLTSWILVEIGWVIVRNFINEPRRAKVLHNYYLLSIRTLWEWFELSFRYRIFRSGSLISLIVERDLLCVQMMNSYCIQKFFIRVSGWSKAHWWSAWKQCCWYRYWSLGILHICRMGYLGSSGY